LNLAAATAVEPSLTHETASENLQDEDEDPCDKPTLDEDPNDEVDDDEDLLAEVKLAATIREAFLNLFLG
jgi:hypothetical protein